MEKYSVENVLIAVLGLPCICYLILIGLGYLAGIDVVDTAMFLYFNFCSCQGNQMCCKAATETNGVVEIRGGERED